MGHLIFGTTITIYSKSYCEWELSAPFTWKKNKNKNKINIHRFYKFLPKLYLQVGGSFLFLYLLLVNKQSMQTWSHNTTFSSLQNLKSKVKMKCHWKLKILSFSPNTIEATNTHHHYNHYIFFQAPCFLSSIHL